MPDLVLPGALWTPGRNAGYNSGRNRMEICVEHFTVGRDSRNIGLNGYFHMLFPKVGPPYAYAEIDAITWHAGPYNPNGPGWEFERLGYDDPLTEDQMSWGAKAHEWMHEWGIPMEHYDGPRFKAITSRFRGFVNHGDLDDQRSDGVTGEEFTTMTGPPEDQPEDDKMIGYITKKSEPGVGIWATDQIHKRHVFPDEWDWINFLATINKKPAPLVVPVTDQWWDSLPVAE
jgi:hypothetical protein